jgi:Fe-S-cluster-containing dehydrogenase component/formate-dependent nitrite reductase membrane component NrfD
MRYGFVVDNRKCIGCHACTVACKTENRVPLGVNRTWVKYVEKGRFPSVRRFFQVTRCNHCDNPPCVAICPVGAMFRRPDGIVDFDPARCLGCKACQAACPYDAIYVDPESRTAAKCHYCAHRVERGMEPACAAVCPEHAIVAGDVDDPQSEIGRLVAREGVKVRKPEQGTRPKLWYVDGEDGALVPTAPRVEPFYLWSERNARVAGGPALRLDPNPLQQPDLLAAYDVDHGRPWDWQVPVYFWTKSLGAGLLLLPALALLGGWLAADRVRHLVLTLASLGFMALTAVLLISDLARKERFLDVVLRPRAGSWLSRGAWLLVAYSACCGLYGLAQLLGPPAFAAALLWPTALLGLGAAGYTAFLFGQCEGCDLWQTPLLPLHVVAQAVLCSAAVLALLPEAWGGGPAVLPVAWAALAVGLAVHLLAVLGEVAVPHATDNARYAARLVTHGPFSDTFWAGSVVAGGLAPAVLLATGPHQPATGAAAALILLGLLAYEWCFVRAGQGVPNS